MPICKRVSILLVITLVLSTNLTVSGAVAKGKPKVQSGISGIDELPNRFKEIKLIAWNAMNKNAKHKVRKPLQINYLVSPNAKDCSKAATPIIRKFERIYHGTLMPRSLTLIFVDESRDSEWLIARTNELLPERFRTYQGSKQINPETVNSNGDGVLWSSNPCRDSGKLSMEEKNEIAHGFAHVIQRRQFIEFEDDWGRWGEVPRWIFEGCAVFNDHYWTFGKNYETYLRNSDNLYELKRFPSEFFQQFLFYEKSDGIAWSYTDQWPNQRVYDVGSYVCETLVALRGPESTMNLYLEYLKTGDFNKAFENIYGMSWSQAHPIMAKTVYDLIQWNSKL